MKLLEVLPLLESRKNPEQNPKLSAYEQLLKYAHNPNVYISMTYLPKLGINPMSEYNTPIGIYCYPLKAVWDLYHFDENKSLKELPYVADARYIQVFEWNGKGKFLNVDNYNEQDLNQDIEKIKELYSTDEALSKKIDTGIIYSVALATKPKYAASKLFSVLMGVNSLKHFGNEKGTYTKRVLGRDMDVQQGVEFLKYSIHGRESAKILRYLGYAGMVDYGHGIIHKNEPTQAFFLSMEYINHLETILNKDYLRYNKNVESSRHGGLYIGEVNGKSLILAPKKYERGFNYYQDAVDYVKSLPGKWVIPSRPEFVLIGNNLKMLNNEYKFLNYDKDEVSYWTSSYEAYKHDDTQNIVFEYHNDNHIDFGRASTGWKPMEGAKPLDEIYYYVRPIKLV